MVLDKSEEDINIDRNCIYNKDCLDALKYVSEKSIDLILTDPPFGIEFSGKSDNYNRDSNLVLDGYIEVKENYYEFTNKWITESKRILKDTGSIFVFSGYNNLLDILLSLRENNFHVVNHLIWKFQFGMCTKKKFVCSHYHCIYACINDKLRKFNTFCRFNRGDKDEKGGSLLYRDMEDVWIINKEYWKGEEETATKLPSEIIRKILQYTTDEGDLVLDPFLGSGQVVVVSKEMKRDYIGFEISKNYYDFAKRRLEE